MDLGTSSTRTRSALVCVAATALAASLMAGLVPVLGDGAVARFDQVLVRLSAAVAASVTAWLWLVTVVVAVDAARGLDHGRRGVPEGVRRGLLVLCGTALTAGLATPALATGGPAPDPGVLSGLRLPERVGVQPMVRARAAPLDSTVLVVAAGDTLWSLAADQIGPDPTADEIATAWPRLYAVNRDVIGPDPSHIEPGQRLVLPAEGDEHDGR